MLLQREKIQLKKFLTRTTSFRMTNYQSSKFLEKQNNHNIEWPDIVDEKKISSVSNVRSSCYLTSITERFEVSNKNAHSS